MSLTWGKCDNGWICEEHPDLPWRMTTAAGRVCRARIPRATSGSSQLVRSARAVTAHKVLSSPLTGFGILGRQRCEPPEWTSRMFRSLWVIRARRRQSGMPGESGEGDGRSWRFREGVGTGTARR
jgi:hypothetical protein